MPIANLKNVFGVSSEDNTCPASNLLSSTNRKWKCESPAPSSIFVILQFEQPVKISGIDIGNEHSAFVEVFVGKNGWNPDKYQQILLSSSFMTPMESRNSTSTNRVRCFAQIALEPTVCAENWDLIKIACTQPFNKHVQYGLSFIKVHCVDAIKKESEMPAKKMKCESLLNLPAYNVFSQFKLRENTPESDEDTKGSSSLFLKWKQSKTTDPDANETIAKPTNGTYQQLVITYVLLLLLLHLHIQCSFSCFSHSRCHFECTKVEKIDRRQVEKWRWLQKR